MGPSATSAGFTRWVGPRTYTTGCIASGPICMSVEPAFGEASPMMINVPVRHADFDGESDDESLPSVVVAAMENLNVLFSYLRLGNGPCYPGEDFDVEALCGSFSRLSIAETPTFDVYPSNVLVFDGPPSSAGFVTPYHVATVSNIMEVMVIGASTSTAHGKASADAGELVAVSANTLQAALTGSRTRIATSTNPTEARASLEEARRKILEEGIAIAIAKRRMEATQREYNSAYGLTLVSESPSRLGSVRCRGLFIAEILGGKQPIYETPAAKLRAAHAAMAEIPSLEGEERVLHEKRIKDLLDAANEQQTRLHPSQGQAEPPGPNPGARRNPGGHHQAEGLSSHHTSDRKGDGSHDRHSQRQSDPTSSRRRGDDESDSVYQVPRPGRTNATGSQGALPIAARIGARVPHGVHDARTRLNALAQSDLLEEDGPIGPTCFGPRIRGEPFPRGFPLPRDTQKYNGTAKPKDWLNDYTTAVGIATGNKRVAIRYMPLMLPGSARTWLNSLPAGSVNSWIDFKEAFVRTYKCCEPGRNACQPDAAFMFAGWSFATPARE
ncbi:hypothetical protein ZWY2020_019914 [Hordeum vulgare]|nr:hypothetical protein ZWY2020_019914 [Hordeum vulgare]